jgi:hypothetical protein
MDPKHAERLTFQRRDELEHEIVRVQTEILRIDEHGELVHTHDEKWELAKELADLEARVEEEWR